MKRILILLFTLATAIHGAEFYELHLHRPYKVGQKFEFSATASVDSVMSFSAEKRVFKEKKLDVWCDVEGELEVVTVDARGKLTGASLKVTKAKGRSDGKPVAHFKSGDVIRVTPGQNDLVNVEMNGEEPGDAQTELARVLVPTGSQSDLTDDDTYGPRRGVCIGEQWPANTKALEEDIATLARIPRENINVTAQLDGISEVDGKRCFRVRVSGAVKSGGVIPGREPDDLEVRNLSLDADIEMLVPVDRTLPHAGSKASRKMEWVGGGSLGTEGEEGGKAELSFSAHRKWKSDYRLKPIK